MCHFETLCPCANVCFYYFQPFHDYFRNNQRYSNTVGMAASCRVVAPTALRYTQRNDPIFHIWANVNAIQRRGRVSHPRPAFDPTDKIKNRVRREKNTQPYGSGTLGVPTSLMVVPVIERGSNREKKHSENTYFHINHLLALRRVHLVFMPMISYTSTACPKASTTCTDTRVLLAQGISTVLFS